MTQPFARLCWSVFLLTGPLRLRADRVDDIARIHVEAIGGKERIRALSSMRAAGNVIANGKQVRFTLVAARPAKVRLETENGGRSLVQAFDGSEPAWEFDTGAWPPTYRNMAESSAKTFVADAEFDDPLVGGEMRGYVFDYAGELEINGRKLLRILVTRKMTDTYSLLLDDETYFVAMRIEHRLSAGGRKMQVATHYEDFRPVDGVLLPHRVIVAVDGKVTQETIIDRIDPNPKLKDDVFTRPKVSVPAIRAP